LPSDVRGVERVDDRRVISGSVHVLKSGFLGAPKSLFVDLLHRLLQTRAHTTSASGA
jgi:hypothetical protein